MKFYLNDHTTARMITINYVVNLDVKLIKYKTKENQDTKCKNIKLSTYPPISADRLKNSHHHGKQKSYPRLFFVAACSTKMTTKLLLITCTSS